MGKLQTIEKSLPETTPNPDRVIICRSGFFTATAFHTLDSKRVLGIWEKDNLLNTNTNRKKAHDYLFDKYYKFIDLRAEATAIALYTNLLASEDLKWDFEGRGLVALTLGDFKGFRGNLRRKDQSCQRTIKIRCKSSCWSRQSDCSVIFRTIKSKQTIHEWRHDHSDLCSGSSQAYEEN